VWFSWVKSAAGAAATFLAALSFVPAAGESATLHHERHARAYHIALSVSLSAYTDAHAVGLTASGTIAGDAVLGGSRRCLLASAGTMLDISPSGWDSCSIGAMSSNGTVAGRVTTGDKSEGFIYRAGRAYLIPDVASFLAINAAALAIAVKQDGTRAVYDAQNGTWPVFADAGRGCAIEVPLALNDRLVFGSAHCSDGTVKYGLADRAHYASVTLPAWLVPSGILTAADQLVLADPRSGGHAYLWSAGTRAPLDLGEAPGYLYGSYTPVAANASGEVVGQNYPQFFSWVHTASDGTRDLDNLIAPPNFFGISVAAIDEAGNVLVQALDFTTGGPVWLVLQPG